MEETFDPYREWLGMPEGHRPTNHYQLLGIAPFESDPEAIAHRADVLLARLRGIRPGEHLVPWQQIIDRLTAAKACLLDPAAKASYDAALRGPAEDDSTPSSQSTSSPQFSRPVLSPVPLIARMAVVMLVVAAAMVGVALLGRHGRPSSTDPTASVSTSPPPAASSSTLGQPPAAGPVAIAGQPPPATLPPATPTPGVLKPAAEPAAAAKPRPVEDVEGSGPSADPKRPEPAADPKKHDTLRRELAAARAAMARRDLAAARKHVQAATAAAQDPQQQAEAGRVESLLGNLEEFWKGIGQVIATLAPAQELSAGDARYIVVGVTPQTLTLRTEGRNRDFDLRNLPRPIVEALVRSGFNPHPSTKILLGAYLATDPQGDRREARKLWEEATREGEDVSELLKELEAWGAGGPGKDVPGVRGAPPRRKGRRTSP